MRLFGQRTRPATRGRPAPALNLERLDERALPTASPSVSGLSLNVVGSNLVVSGHVVDSSPSADTVIASGDITGSVVSSSGDFQLSAPYTGSGNVTISVHGETGLNSPDYFVTLTSTSASSPSPQPVDSFQPAPNQPPVLNFQVAYGAHRTITISGIVSDENAAGLLISFSGAAAASVTTDASGHFSLTVTATSLGHLNGSVQDRQGLQSMPTFVTLISNQPSVDSFTCFEISPDVFQLHGHVNDPLAAGLSVQFNSEITAINGQTATVDSDGWFTFTVTLTNVQDVGPVNAVFTNWWGDTSTTVTTMVVR